MGMNIKNAEVERLAHELSARSGLSLTGAIRIALKEKLERMGEAREAQKQARRDAVRDVLARSGPTVVGLTSAHDDLYDEKGLPK